MRVLPKICSDLRRQGFNQALDLEGHAHLISRYAGQEPAYGGLYIVGLYCRQDRNYAEAARTFKRLVEEAPHSASTREAGGGLLSEALYNSGQQEQAIELWLSRAAEASDPGYQAGCFFQAAVLLELRGGEHLTKARALFQRSVALVPNGQYAEGARAGLERASMAASKREIGVDAPDILDVLDMKQVPIAPSPRPRVRDILPLRDGIQVLEM